MIIRETTQSGTQRRRTQQIRFDMASSSKLELARSSPYAREVDEPDIADSLVTE